MSSPLLRDLFFDDHRLEDVPSDGNCFYAALLRGCDAKGWDAPTLRNHVYREMGALEAELSNAVDPTPASAKFADAVELSIAARLFTDIALFVVNESDRCVVRASPRAPNRSRLVVLHLYAEHYRLVRFDRADDAALFLATFDHEREVTTVPSRRERSNLASLLVPAAIVGVVLVLCRAR